MGAIVDRQLAMHYFEEYHWQQLLRAREELMFGTGRKYWRIALWQPLNITPPDDIQVLSTDHCITIKVKLDDRDRLMPADEASEHAVDEWEKKL